MNLPTEFEKREVCGRECVYVRFSDWTDMLHDLAADLHGSGRLGPFGQRDSPCILCPTQHADEPDIACVDAECGGGYLVDLQWVPILLMRAANSNS